MESQNQNQPNIVLIMVDDMGFSDIGCYGSEIETPNLDALAHGGLRFGQMYNCARCCPTRASLLTGLYPHQAGVGHMVGDHGVGPAYQGYLRDDCLAVAETLKQAGYRTLMSGKWHAGGEYAANKPDSWTPGDAKHPTPRQRGFDEHYGMLGGAGSYFNPPYMVNNDQIIQEGQEGYYITDAISTHAVDMIKRNHGDQPFFMYVAYTAPHWPLHALPEDIEKYVGKYKQGGWDAIRAARYQRLIELGIISSDWSLSPRDAQSRPWTEVEEKDWEDLRMAVYAAQIDRMDQGIGQIMETIRELGLEEDTLVMFLSDNGGCAEFMAEDSDKPQPSRYNIPTYDGRPMRVGNTPTIDPGPDDTFMSYDLPWANASNTPFRYYKHWVHEGGIATPFIAYWPRVIKEQKIVQSPWHLIDITATCLDIAGATVPKEHSGTAITPLEGVSFLPLLQGDTYQRNQPIFWEHEGNRAVRLGDWKLVRRYPSDWELYNMSDDRTELHDLAETEPERVSKMTVLYQQWAARCQVEEWPIRKK